MSSVLQMLLSVSQFHDTDFTIKAELRRAVDALLKLQQANGNFPASLEDMDECRPEDDELVHWCHGAPGK